MGGAKNRALRFIARCMIFKNFPHHIGVLHIGNRVNLERRRLFNGNAQVFHPTLGDARRQTAAFDDFAIVASLEHR